MISVKRFPYRVLSAVVLLMLGAMLVAGTARAAFLQLRVPSRPVVIRYEDKNERVAKRVAEICEDRLDELSAQLGMGAVPPIEILIVDDVGSYGRRIGSDLPAWGVAFALMGQGKMVVDAKRATQAWNSLESVIPHEFSHLLYAHRVGMTPTPIWFLEGLAQWQAGEWSLVDSWQLMNAVWSNQAPKLWQLQNQYPPGEEGARNGYRVSYVAFTKLFDGRTSDIPSFLDEIERQGDFEEAFLAYFLEYPMSFYVRFQQRLESRYHSRLLVFQSGPLFSILAAAFLILAIRYHIRKRRRLQEMADEPGGGGGTPDSA
jgi:hypothetical protein